MATLVGSASIKGSTETVRMVLLTFATIGITCVSQLTRMWHVRTLTATGCAQLHMGH